MSVPIDVRTDTATIEVRQGDLVQLIEIPYRSLQRAECVTLVFGDGRDKYAFRGAEITEPTTVDGDRSFLARQGREAQQVEPQAPVVNVKVEPTPVTIENLITVQDEPVPQRVKFKRRKDGTVDEAIITTDENQ